MAVEVERESGVKWLSPAKPGEKARVERDGEAVEFAMVPPEPAKFFSFVRELRRHLMMHETLWKAFHRFESGEANYRNASANLDHLTAEMLKTELAMLEHAAKFWAMTDISKNPEMQQKVTSMFGTDGNGFMVFLRDCCASIALPEGAQKNS